MRVSPCPSVLSFLLAGGAVLAIAFPAAAVPAEAPPEHPVAEYSVELPRLETAPEIDGLLGEAEWSGSAVLDGFVQIEPDEGSAATEPTEVRVGYDRENLYFGVRAHDSDPDALVANILRRDGDLSYDDTIEIVLDTNRDRRTGFLFATNPLGVQVDALVRSEGEDVNLDWDGVWRCRAVRDAGGYTVEIAIPFRILRFPEGGVHSFGFNVMRLIPRKRETSFWKPMSKEYGFYARYKVSRFGELTGMEGLEPGRSWVARPYVTAGYDERTVDGDGTSTLTGGGDFKWSLTTDLVADFTLNTDFAEAEADAQQVNLTRFPLYFPEKREFFLEGANLFYFGERPEPYRAAETQLFFSRRIGLTDSGGQEIPVLGGAKLSGRLGAWDVGLLNLTTREEFVEQVGGGGFTEPRTNYTVARVKRDLGSDSWIGALALATEPSGGDYNRVGGLDWDVGLMDNLRTGGYLVQSRTRSGGRSVDGDDWSGYADVNWDSKHSRARVAYTEIGENFIDELGFVPRRGVRKWRAYGDWILWPEPENRLNVRQAWFTYGLDYITDRHDELETRVNTLQFNTWLNNNAGIAFKWFDNLEVLTAPFEIHPGVVIEPGEYRFDNAFFGFNTDYSKPLGAVGRVSWGDFWNGELLQTLAGLTYRPIPGLFSVLVYERIDVDLPVGDFVEDLVQADVSYAFSPRLALSSTAQWRADQNTLVKAVLRWTFRPGSDFYLVIEDLDDLTDGTRPLDPQVGLPGTSIFTKTVVSF
ncbi:MAG: DUF5916 domain-containing protein [Acidobacteriota bacterium]|jgi:hypothetical protein